MTEPAAATMPVKKSSVWEDCVDIFFAPRSVYERRRDGRWGVPLLIYTLLSAVLLFAARPMMQPMLDRQIAAQAEQMNQQEMSAEQRERAMEMSRGMMESPYAIIPIALVVPIAVFLVALLLWVAGKLFGSTQSLGQSITIATFASFPRLLIGIIALAILYATGSEGMSSQYASGLSPATLMPEGTSTMVLALLSRFELGTIWATVLLGVGTYVMGRVSKQSAAIVAVLVWIVATLFTVGSAAMQG